MTAKQTILWIEGRWASDSGFIPSLRKKGYQIETVSNGQEALSWIKKKEPAVVVVDAVSMRTTGTRICKNLRQLANGLPIMLITAKDKKVDKDFDYANSVLTLPFTARKLVNRIDPLMPSDKGSLEKYGPIHLDTKRRQMVCHDKKTPLTPRLVRLLEELLMKRGEVVEREELFKKVWRTTYTGDTRTLDVHISWLRDAIEKDPRKPKLLKTIRGVGYRLDV
ncbi:response regulator transcription factor [Chloroflexota bacterium]